MEVVPTNVPGEWETVKGGLVTCNGTDTPHRPAAWHPSWDKPKKKRGRPATGQAKRRNITLDPECLPLLHSAREKLSKEIGCDLTTVGSGG